MRYAQRAYASENSRESAAWAVLCCSTVSTGGASVRAVLGMLIVTSAAWLPITAAAQGNPSAAALKNPVPASAESIDAGKRLYQRHCASCHGANAEGGAGNDLIPAAPDLTDKEWKHGGSDGEIFSAIKNGIPP